jgi:phage-related protein
VIFNGIEKDYLTVLRGRKRPVVTEMNPEISVPVLIQVKPGDSLEQLKEDISYWLYHEENKRLMFKDNLERYYMAKLLDIDIERTNNRLYGEGEIIFTCEDDPYRFGLHQQIPVTADPSTHQITGQTETPWTIEVTFDESASQFELEAGDLYLLLNYEFIAGDILTINYTGREVWLRDVDLRMSVALASNFVELQPGEVEVSASHDCVLKYDERYY